MGMKYQRLLKMYIKTHLTQVLLLVVPPTDNQNIMDMLTQSYQLSAFIFILASTKHKGIWRVICCFEA